MTSVADALFAAGLVPLTEAVHGETVTMLSGDDAGKLFIGVITLEQDIVFTGDIGEDRRAKRTISFLGIVPRIAGHATLKASDGKTWKAVRMPGDSHLSTEFELVKVTAGDQ